MNELKIGWAARDISTDKPVGIRGQMHLRISTGILDPLTLASLVIDNGDDSVIFLSVDCVGIRSYLVKDIRERLKKLNPDIPAGKIIINATHTHSGGDLYADGSESFACDVPRMSGKEYSDFVAGQAADAIAEAWKNRKPGGVAWGYGYAVVSHQRRVVYFDDFGKRKGGAGATGFAANGHGVMYGNTNDPQFSHYETGADAFVNLLYTFDAEGKLTGAIINVPAPSQNSEHISKLSADFWNDVRVALKKEYGDINILPQCAAAGDLSPRILHYKQAQSRRFSLKYGNDITKEAAERRDIAQRIAFAFTETLDWAKKDIRRSLPLNHIVETVELPRLRITKEQYEVELKNLKDLENAESKKDGTPLEKLHADSRTASLRNRCKSIISRYENQDKDPNLPMEMHVVKIGDIAFASNRFELYMDYMHRIQARSPFEQTFIIQLAGTEVGNGGGSYLPTQRAAENKGYGAIHYSNIVGPEGGQVLVEETVKALNKLAFTLDNGNLPITAFSNAGDYDYLCEKKKGAYVCPAKVAKSKMSAPFYIADSAYLGKELVLELEGQSCDKLDVPPSPMRVTINDKKVFEGSCGFVKRGWSKISFDIPAGVLKDSENKITFENLSDGNREAAGWIMISQIKFKMK